MKNLKFTVNELSRKPFSGIIIIAQIVVAVIILIEGLTDMFTAMDNVKETKKLIGNKNLYALSSDGSLDESNDTDEEKYKEFYDFLESNYKGNMFCSINQGMLIKDFTSDSKFYCNKDEKYCVNPQGVEGTYSNVKNYCVNYNYNKLFHFSLINGRYFEKNEFQDSDVISVILGYNYKGIYKVGDTFFVYDYITNENKKIKVIGILKNNSYILDGTSISNLDNCIISPIGSMYKLDRDLGYYLSYLDSTYIISNNKDESSKSIIEKTSELGVLNFKMLNCRSGMSSQISYQKNKARSSLSLSVCILLFTSIAIITVQMNRIKEMMCEIGIQLLSGATKKDICLHNIYSISIYLFLGIVIGSIYEFKFANTGYDYSNIDIRIIIILIVLSIILLFVISFLPYRKIKEMEIKDIIRGISK